MPPRSSQPLVLLLGLLTLAGCSGEEILHGLDEAQANRALVALDEGGVRAVKRRDEGSEGAWRIEVRGADATRAHRLLAERELPRARPPGFGEVFGKGSVVPTPSEERALYQHALSGELARSVEAIDGVLEARVHLAWPQPDPLRPEPAAPPRASVLVKCRPGARAALDLLAPGVRALVAGAVPGLDAAAVSIVVAEAGPAPRVPAAEPVPRRRAALLALAAAAALAALATAVVPLCRGRLDPRRLLRRRPS
jgi:type III secretion protein J